MIRFFRKGSSKRRGLPPGSMVYLGDTRTEDVSIQLIDYTAETVEERTLETIEQSFDYKQKESVTWINVNGIHDSELISRVGEHFGIHSLTIEDVLNTGHRPKAELFENHVFIILKMLSCGDNEINSEQISLILGDGYVISFQEHEGDVFAPVRDRIRHKKGRVRNMGADYLAYSLMDAIIDNYFVVLEHIGEKLEELDRDIASSDALHDVHRQIHRRKMEIHFLRKAIWPLRELIGHLTREETPLINKACAPFYRDLYDHTIHIIDTIETFRDVAAGIMDLYMSAVSNRMNEVMKVLTIIATIFIPLTFVAGVYGMNFKYMPELEWKYAYPAVWALMLAIAGGMIAYFKKRKWL